MARYAWYLGDIDETAYLRILAATRHLHDKGFREPRGQALLPMELQALVKACGNDSSERRFRNIALFMVAACTGFRKHELANLKLSNFERVDGMMRITRIGKRNREHHAFVVGSALKALDTWLA